MENPKSDPPAHLSLRSAALWVELAPNNARSLGRRVLFQTGLEALDRADEARAIVAREGAMFKTKKTGAIHLHPALQIERQALTEFLRIWSRLGLHFDYRIDGQV